MANKNISVARVAANLYGVDLSGTNLSGTVINGADFSETDLREANLNRAALTRTNLGRSDLGDALEMRSLGQILVALCCGEAKNGEAEHRSVFGFSSSPAGHESRRDPQQCSFTSDHTDASLLPSHFHVHA